MALFVFADGVITNEDIDIGQKIRFSDYFCTKEDISIGEPISNELSFRLMNEKQKLNDFPFGEFNALLGVQIGSEPTESWFSLTYGGHVFRYGSVVGQRLTKDGSPTSGQPSFNPVALAAMDGKVYCFGAAGQTYAVMAGTGARTTWPQNAFMTEKIPRFAGNTYSYENRILTINRSSGSRDTYEFVPLGIFTAERPKVTDDIQIDIVCYDRMQRFDADMAELSITYPITLGALLARICESENVPLETTSFLNMNISVPKAPEQFESCSKRDVIGWIAEAAGRNAKISRDGRLKLVWLNSTTVRFDESGYTECRPYNFQTPRVSKLYVRDMDSSADRITGSGNSAYLIQDNPFL
jgi:hypothetical protein